MSASKKLSKMLWLSFVLILLVENDNSTAGTLKVVNYTKSPVEINVVNRENGKPYCKKCVFPGYVHNKNPMKIIVPLNLLKGRESFSIIDISNGFLGGGKCQNLSVHKNYEISFFETMLGTRCQHKEI